MTLGEIAVLVGDDGHPLAGEEEVAGVVASEADAAERGEDPVDAGLENGLEAAVARDQHALVITDDDTTEHGKFSL